MPNAIRNGKYGRMNGNPRVERGPRVLPGQVVRRPRIRVASALAGVRAGGLASSVDDMISSRLGGLGECVAEWLQQRTQRFSGDQSRDDGVGPDGLVWIGDE